MAGLQVVVFSLSNQMYGADTSQVQEIIKYTNISRVPKLPKFIDGVTNLRGRVVPVINLNKRFGLPETDITRKTKIIITQLDNTYAGFIVDDVTEIIKLSDEETELPPECIYDAGGAYIKTIGKKGDRLISILDLNKILTKSEIKKLALKETAHC